MATHFFQSFELECDEVLVSKWMDKSQVGQDLKNNRNKIDEWDMYNFSDWLRVYGTAYEEGIDDQIQIARLSKEIELLKKEIAKLQQENYELVSELDILPF